MKIKNIAVGSYIQSKKDSKQLIAGHCYQVAEKDVSDKTVRLFSVDDSFDDSLWFCVSDFRKPRPQLKQLDHSVFDGVFNWVKSAAVNPNGSAYLFSVGKDDFYNISEKHGFQITGRDKCQCIGLGYDTTNWQNSLIERHIAKELTGSELCRAMIIGDRDWVLAYVSNESDATALFHKNAMVVTDFDLSEDAFYCRGENFAYAVPINNKGEPLTASEAGL